MVKLIFTGWEKTRDELAYDTLEKEDLKAVHVHDEVGDGERTVCSIDTAHGIIMKRTDRAVTCKTCLQAMKYYQSVKLGKG